MFNLDDVGSVVAHDRRDYRARKQRGRVNHTKTLKGKRGGRGLRRFRHHCALSPRDAS